MPPRPLFDYGITATSLGERRVKVIVWFTSNDQLSNLHYQIAKDSTITILSGTVPTQGMLVASELLTTEFEIQLADDSEQRFGLLVTGSSKTHGGFAEGPIIHLRFWNGELNSVLESHY